MCLLGSIRPCCRGWSGAQAQCALMGAPRGVAVPDRKERKALAQPVGHPAPCLTHYRYCPFILTNLEVAVSYIRVIALAFPFITVGLISGRVFQGLGSGLPGLVLTSLRVVVISVPLAYLFTRVLGFGLMWVWGSFAVAGVISSVVAIVWIQRRLRQVEGALAADRAALDGAPGIPYHAGR